MSSDGVGGPPAWTPPHGPPPPGPPQQGPPVQGPPVQGPPLPGPQQQGPPQQGPPQHGPPPPGWGPSPYGPVPTAYAAVKPGVVPLRPLSVMEILDGSVSTARRHPAVTLGITAVVVTIATLVTAATAVLLLADSSSVLSETDPTAKQWRHFAADALPYGLVTALASLAAQVVLTGILTAVIGRAVLGRPVVLAEIWREVRPRLLPLVGLILTVLLVLGVAIGVAVGVAVLVGVLSVPAAGILVGVALGLALVVGVLYTATMLGVAGPAVVLERAGVRTALRRSYRLVKGSFWRVFGVLALVQIVAQLAGGLISVPFIAVAAVFAALLDTTSFGLVPQIVSGLGQIASGVITNPIAAGATALLYVDLRMRREGLDIELARAAGQQRQPTP